MAILILLFGAMSLFKTPTDIFFQPGTDVAAAQAQITAAAQNVLKSAICARLAWLGVRLDVAANAANAACISAPDSEIEVRVIATDEEATIARHTRGVVAATAE